MPKFSYIASNSKGDSVRGTLQAVNKGELARMLSAQGLFMVTCKMEEAPVMATFAPSPLSAPARKAVPAARAAESNSLSPYTAAQPGFHKIWEALTNKKNELSPNTKPKGSITLKELVVLTRQLSISINAGMSFVDALQGMAQHNKNPLMAYTLRHILDDVLSGKKFSEALAAQPDVFEAFYVSMAAAGEAGGFMPDALNRIAEFLEKEMELRSKIKSAMIYPVVIAMVAAVVVTGMMAYIVPTFVKVFKEMNAPLPGPTKLLVIVSDITRHGGFLFPLVFVAIYFFVKHLRNTNEKFRVFYDERVLKLPLFGRILTLEIITRFIRTLASLADNGVAILLSLSVARQVVGNRTIEKVVDEIYSSVQQGNGISPVLYKSPYFPVLVANMVATGEKTGSIPEVLTKMANYYDAEVAAAVRDLLTLMEPMLIVVMAVIVGFIVAGLMLPTFQMSSFSCRGNMKALVAEDDPDIQVILRMVLTRMGKCEVTLTDRGDMLVPLAKTHLPDFILLDVMLPEMSGYEICKALKAEETTKNIPVIFLTARSMPSEIKEALSLGALGYLAKPFDPMTLVAQINTLLAPVGCTIGG